MEVNHKIDAVIWDMGGVLLRSEHYQFRDKLAERFMISRLELEHRVFNSDSAMLATVGKITQIEHWANTARSLGMSDREIEDFQEAFWAGDRCDDELVRFIRSLKQHYKTGLLSNAWMGTREMLKDKYGCLDIFDLAVFSYEVGLAKPDAEIYRYILERLDVVPERTIFVDDFEPNIAAARELGIIGIHFKGRNQVIQEINQIIS